MSSSQIFAARVALSPGSGAYARRAYSTNRCLTARWSASRSSQASLSTDSGIVCSRDTVSDEGWVHLAAEVPMARDAGDELGRSRVGIGSVGEDEAGAAL